MKVQKIYILTIEEPELPIPRQGTFVGRVRCGTIVSTCMGSWGIPKLPVPFARSAEQIRLIDGSLRPVRYFTRYHEFPGCVVAAQLQYTAHSMPSRHLPYVPRYVPTYAVLSALIRLCSMTCWQSSRICPFEEAYTADRAARCLFSMPLPIHHPSIKRRRAIYHIHSTTAACVPYASRRHSN